MTKVKRTRTSCTRKIPPFKINNTTIINEDKKLEAFAYSSGQQFSSNRIDERLTKNTSSMQHKNIAQVR